MNGSQTSIDELTSVQAQRAFANDQQVPYLITFSFLHAPTPMVHLVPGNHHGEDFLFDCRRQVDDYKFNIAGVWMTPRQWSQALTYLHGEVWNPQESFSFNSKESAEIQTMLGLASDKLGDLPHQRAIYRLPTIKLNP